MEKSKMIDKHGIPAHYRTFETLLVQVCAPTLAGLKPGSIVSVCGRAAAIEDKVEHWNRILHAFGLSLEVLMDKEKLSILYLYRKRHMEALFADPRYGDFLAEQGYAWTDFAQAKEELRQRLQQGNGFPHEIGLFLGYPFEDVKGFIENKGQNCTCCGMWKSWGDPEEMQKCFARYDKCIRVYSHLFEAGRPLEKLAVAC